MKQLYDLGVRGFWFTDPQFNPAKKHIEDAKKLYKFTKHMPSKINLIEYNEVYSLKFQKSTEEKTKIFMNYLEKSGVNVNLRRSRGKDINAACGQLANNN